MAAPELEAVLFQEALQRYQEAHPTAPQPVESLSGIQRAMYGGDYFRLANLEGILALYELHHGKLGDELDEEEGYPPDDEDIRHLTKRHYLFPRREAFRQADWEIADLLGFSSENPPRVCVSLGFTLRRIADGREIRCAIDALEADHPGEPQTTFAEWIRYNPTSIYTYRLLSQDQPRTAEEWEEEG